MTLSEAAVLLRGLAPRLLEGLTAPERSALFETATVKRFEPGSLITQEGFRADFIALLVQGRARFCCTTLTGRKLNLRWIYPGEICGFAALVPHQCDYLLSAEVVRASRALVWHRSAIRSFAATCPQLLDNGLSLAFDYFRLYKVAHLSATSHTARQRLAFVLRAMA